MKKRFPILTASVVDENILASATTTLIVTDDPFRLNSLSLSRLYVETSVFLLRLVASLLFTW